MGRNGDSPASLRPLSTLGIPERRLLVALWVLVAAAVAGQWALLVMGGAVPEAVVRAWGETATCAAGAVALTRAVLVPRDRVRWTLIGTAVVLMAVGDVVWATTGEPEVSVAEAIRLCGMAALTLGLGAVLRDAVPRATWTTLTDAATAALTVAATGVALLAPWAMGVGEDRLAMGVGLAFPMWDLALLAMVVGAGALSGWRPCRAVGSLTTGVALLLVGDLTFVSGLGHGVAHPLDRVLMVFAYLVIGAAGWQRTRRSEPARHPSSRAVAMPFALGAVAVGILVTAAVREVNVAAVALAAGAVLTVLVRGALLRTESWALARELATAAHMAARDPLTGLLTHRAFRERVAEEVAGAARTREPVSVVLLDLDHFALVNEAHGHGAGDDLLRAVADRLRDVARADDVLARIGGEEFAWVLPGADDLAAWDAAERARHAIASIELPGMRRVTVSGGVADLRHARDAAELVKLADGALYWAKAHGRDVVFRYSTEVVRALSADERARQLMRGQALNAMRVLARAVDARDRYTAQHSERVADLCVRLATALGWDHPRIITLQEAALVHDVGKIGIPDAILLKESSLTEEERLRVEGHAAMGAQIVADVLSAEQAAWVRSHHERYDGAGYPDMLRGEGIPEGARILTVADSWDAMTTDRPYRAGLPVQEALGRLVAGRGRQFCPRVVDGMVALHEHGLLEPVAAAA